MNPEMAAAMAAAMAAMSAASVSNDDSANSAALAAEFAVLATGKQPKSHPMPYDVMTASQVAEYFQLPETLVIAEASAGKLPGRRIGGEWRFVRIALTEWLHGRERPPPTSPPQLVWTPEAEVECEREIAAIYTARKALGTVGGHFPTAGDE